MVATFSKLQGEATDSFRRMRLNRAKVTGRCFERGLMFVWSVSTILSFSVKRKDEDAEGTEHKQVIFQKFNFLNYYVILQYAGALLK
jgi:hypothetical protein